MDLFSDEGPADRYLYVTTKVFAFGLLLTTAEVSVFVSTARSSFFDVSTRAVDSPDPLKEAKEGIEGDGSCPVLPGDTPAEAVRANQSLIVVLISFLVILFYSVVVHYQ